jgi:hypothetical protein
MPGYDLEHTFYVTEDIAHVPLILGLDLSPRLGIRVEGLAHCFFDEVPTENRPPAAPLDPLPALAEGETIKWVRSALAEPLARNAALSSNGVCNHPDASLHLPLHDVEPVFQRQYRIPHHRQQAVEDSVKEWLDTGVVVPINRTNWNAPLICVPKKDAMGNRTGTHVCLYPRPINARCPITSSQCQ